MRFGRFPVDEAEGAVNVHALRLPGIELKKGAPIDRPTLEKLRAAGVKSIVAARLEPGDVGEDQAAARIAAAIAGDHVRVDRAFTGRANLRAGAAGLMRIDRRAVDALNRIDEAATLATLPEFHPVEAGAMVATVKIIPFAVPAGVMERIRLASGPMVQVAPFRLTRAAVICTMLPGSTEKVVAGTLRTMAARLAAAGARIVSEERVRHEDGALAPALRRALACGAEIAIVFGASAIADRLDVIPAGIEAAGGRIDHFGMPVDPGNLLLVGRIGDMPVLGAPGCARSPKENGFDWVLHRLLAGLDVTSHDIMSMGVGGLLMEIPSRPQPREKAPDGSEGIGVVVLAAGRGTRMPHAYKLTATVNGEPLVRRAVRAALASKQRPVVVVTGHEAEEVRRALAGLDVKFVHNPDFADGLSTSLKAGIAALPPKASGAVVTLADMPKVDAGLIDRLAEALDDEAGTLVAVPVAEGRRGNPVAWSARLFPELAALSGDIGARHLIAAHAEAVAEVPVEGDAAFADIDTREELEALEIHELAEKASVDAGPALDAMKAEDA
ncbi:molybdopterin-binding/glycosyltransferase family 2 protein [Ancylobacter sp. MQZ15Z-1]|uniref:Molybdopterin-binding/glycosyltransferase family 2 protein n=1 Tax=Ancylobacter mangrovi TaxID=2972472 RepID=A0A9X2PEN9_9HYPH|nr:molybdopterin-binding/glycosyltransferase family 2 protein [Ancylobacter mangrovi]MCS0496009.1 molybdopterin-binding/glycosyltransferase family 2 protein [Ancylobacter mangrovi]